MLDESVLRLLGTVDVMRTLRSVELTVGQVARLCRVTPRQVFYWAERGIISGTKRPGRAMTYDLGALEKVLLVRTLLDAGYSLDAATSLTAGFLSLRSSEDHAEAGNCATYGPRRRGRPGRGTGDYRVREPSAVWGGEPSADAGFPLATLVGVRLERLEEAVFGTRPGRGSAALGARPGGGGAEGLA